MFFVGEDAVIQKVMFPPKIGWLVKSPSERVWEHDEINRLVQLDVNSPSNSQILDWFQAIFYGFYHGNSP